jgi:hypothetical protein
VVWSDKAKIGVPELVEAVSQLSRRQHMTASSDEPDRLVQELQRCETDLQKWLQQSTVNSLWFAVDPVDAMRAAGLGIPEELLAEMAQTLISVRDKLHAVAAQPPQRIRGRNRAAPLKQPRASVA